MSPLLPIDRLYSIGVVVRDLEAATRRHAEIFGIDHWEVRELTGERLGDMRSFGRPVTAAFRTATGVAPNGTVTFELVQPLSGESPFQDFRFRRREGISHLTLAVRSPDEWQDLEKELSAHGLRVAASMTIDGAMRRHFIDTRAALGGYYVEVQVPLGGAATGAAVDQEWDHGGSYTRPEGVPPLPIQGVSHFGVVVRDMPAAVERYADILGVREWGVRDWRPEPGLLESPYYRGAIVDHEYYTGLAQTHDFGFEVIQPTFGASHYNRDFLEQTGEGIHHVLLTLFGDRADWDRSIEWLDSIGAPRVMGADLIHGAASFCYFDTSPSIGGYTVEAVVLNKKPDGPPAPEYLVDFTTVNTSGTRI